MGKSVTDKKWTYGFLSKSRLMGYKNNSLQLCIDHEENGVMLSTVIDPETVRMCTGIKDHAKDDIYDGDILRDRIDYQIGYVEYDEDDGMFAFYVEDIMYGFMDIDSRDYEIIGNIYDNPELLGEV
jgi:hypothetical protein